MAPNKSIGLAQNTVRGRISQVPAIQRRTLPQPTSVTEIADSEEDIETSIIDSSMVEVQIESSNSPKPVANKKLKTVGVPKASPSETKTDDDENSLRCDLCDKEFHSARQRQRHRISHLEHNNVHNCRKCNRGFLDKAELLTHEQTHSRTSRKSESSGGGIKRKSDAEDEQVLMEMTVTEEEVITPDGMYVQDV